jgi:tRNA-splicing ligase RtcB (3'-phosphate/5'-hydroxy nucleic acid ligase)
MAVVSFGEVDKRSLEQLERCRAVERGAPAVLCADHHPGYSMPIGGVIGYERHVSPSAVGFDIACGNLAARTTVRAADVAADIRRVMDAIWRRIPFGIGRGNRETVDSPVFENIARSPVAGQRKLLELAREQLGTVGAGNHYVDLFEDEEGWLWVGVHFGSRGFGFKTASGFLALARGRPFDEHVPEGGMDAPPVVIAAGSPLGQDYIEAMRLAGAYAYAGREWVVDTVVHRILGASVTDRVHNHHNFAWKERHGGRDYWVHRKGATPAFPGQRGFVGATMGEPAVVLRGVEGRQAAQALYSTVHGAGRVMSRTQAAGKFRGWGGKRRQVSRGVVDFARWRKLLAGQGIELRGGAADEAPECYKRLPDVLAAHEGTIEIEHRLQPIGVAMAGPDVADPYKD